MVWIRAAAKASRTEQRTQPRTHRRRTRDARRVNRQTALETGKTTEIDLDSMIAAYSRSTEVPPIEFWRRAVEMWQTSLID